jgi:NAD(P)-dependent dehydrogenase (short-subunit alcohol dehydrogenase family)
MTHPGTTDESGVSTAKDKGFQVPFKIPVSSRPGYGGYGGSPQDIGAVILALATNWFINGETILVDGGTLLKHPSSY